MAQPLPQPDVLPPQPKRALGPAVAGIVLLLVATIGFAAIQLVLARHHLDLAANDVQAAEPRAGARSLLKDGAARASTRQHLVQAEHQFDAARADLALLRPLLDRSGRIPVIGSQLAGAPTLADAGSDATKGALRLFDALGPVWAIAGDSSTQTPLLTRLAAGLDEGGLDFAAAGASMSRALSLLDGMPATQDAGPDRARARLTAELTPLTRLSSWLALAPDLLGGATRRQYLLVWQDPKELRATGGYLAAVDLLHLDKGVIGTHFTGSMLTNEIPAPPPSPQTTYTLETYWLFRDANWSPDFPLSARLERWFYGEDTGIWADGVVNIDPGAAPALLNATGRVYVPEYGKWVSSQNVERLVSSAVAAPHAVGEANSVGDTKRKRVLDALTRAFLRRVQSLPADRWPVLGAAVTSAIEGQRLLLYGRLPQAEAAVQRSAADGALQPAPGDFLAVVDDNRSYNTINPYVQEQATYRAGIMPDRSLRSTLTLRYHLNRAPASMTGYGPEFPDFGSAHDYQDLLRVYVPRGAILQSMSGLAGQKPAGAYGLTQFAGRLLVREGRTATVTIRYIVPANALGPASATQYRLTIQRQPASNLKRVQIFVLGLNGVRVVAGSGSRGAPSRASSAYEIGSVQTIKLTRGTVQFDGAIHGPGQPVAGPLPPGQSRDPYIAYKTFSDPRHPL